MDELENGKKENIGQREERTAEMEERRKYWPKKGRNKKWLNKLKKEERLAKEKRDTNQSRKERHFRVNACSICEVPSTLGVLRLKAKQTQEI